jgi:thioredoxin 1
MVQYFKLVIMEQFKHLDALFVSILLLAISCNSQPKQSISDRTAGNKSITYKVTFVELGSVKCIPCQQMQPVMKSVEQKYGTQVKVVFHDVWTDAGAPYAKKYGIEAIPTQVFLDETGKEYFRHVGFFPEEELIKVLNQKGVK